MYVFRFLFIDKLANEIVGDPQIGIGETQTDAIQDIDLPVEAKKLKKKDQLATIVESLGSYEPIERTYNVNVGEDDAEV